MRIAILNLWNIAENSIGGTERFVDDFSKSLSKDNEVDVYMFSGKNYSKNGVNYISLNIFGNDQNVDEYMICEKFGEFDTVESYISLANIIESKIDSSKYDLFHLNSHLFLKCFQNKNRIITMHSNYEEFIILWKQKAYDLMVEILKEEIKENNLKIVCPSLYYGKQWSKILGEDVFTIYHAINQERLKTNYKKEDLIKKYNLSQDKIKILLPSRLEPIQKRPKYILEGLSKLSEEEKNKYQVIFTGIDTQYEQYINELKNYSNKHGIDSQFVIFDHISEGYKLCDIVCVPSKSESFGYAALEGIVLGIPTILSNIPTYRELKKDNEHVKIFKSKRELANILKLYLDKKNERNIVSKEYLDLFNLEEFGRKYIDKL